MTKEQKNQCQIIIHTAAATAGGCNAFPVPGLGLASDTSALVGMAMALAAVFGKDVATSAARGMAVDAVKRTMLKQTLKMVGKEPGKVVPFLGWAFAATVSAGLVEAAGWSSAAEFEQKSLRAA